MGNISSQNIQNNNNKPEVSSVKMNDIELAEQYYYKGRLLDNNHKYKDAIAHYKKSIQLYLEHMKQLDESNPSRAVIKNTISVILNRAEYLKRHLNTECIVKRPKLNDLMSSNGSNPKSTQQQTPSPIEADQITDSYEKQILNEILDTSPNVKWDDVSGMKFAKQILMETVILPSKRPDIFKGLRAPPRGILLFGPPGTGKTMLAKAVASESKATFFSISASSLLSKFVGESEKTIRAMFSIARKMSPSVIFFDEIDSLLCKRSDNENELSRRVKTEFLVQLDGVKTANDCQILLIGATNRPFELDDAILRRLSKKIYVPLPDDETRYLLIQNCLKNEKTKLSKNDMATIISLSKGYSGSDLVQLCKEAMINTIRNIKSIETIETKDIRPANIDDFKEAFNVIKPSVSPDSLAQYEEWNQQYGASLN